MKFTELTHQQLEHIHTLQQLETQHTHSQPSDSDGDSESETNSPTSGT